MLIIGVIVHIAHLIRVHFTSFARTATVEMDTKITKLLEDNNEKLAANLATQTEEMCKTAQAYTDLGEMLKQLVFGMGGKRQRKINPP